MFVERVPKPFPGEQWGFDNGAYTDWTKGKEFDNERFLRRLDRAYGVGRPYLAVAPDIVAGGERSLEFSLEWLPQLPEWPWYLAVQDGMTLEQVEAHIHKFDGLFLGGSNRFKGTAYHWCKLAHKHGKKFHYGRAGTLRKIQHAIQVGADSLDSAFPLWTWDRLKYTAEVVRGEWEQGTIWGAEETAIRV